jgi:hypothetical protein
MLGRSSSLQYMVFELGEMWAKLRNTKFISKLYLCHGFWQMGLRLEAHYMYGEAPYIVNTDLTIRIFFEFVW